MKQKIVEQTFGFHLQKIPDGGEQLEEIISLGTRLVLSIVPSLLDENLRTECGKLIYGRIHSDGNNYPESLIEILRKNKDNPNITFVQEGYRHCCEKCFGLALRNEKEGRGRQPDCYHEHICIADGSVQLLAQQIENIEAGRNLIKEKTGIEKIFNYCSPNHLGNKDTLIALEKLGYENYIVRNGFNYLLIGGGLISLSSYKSNGLNVIPESILSKGGVSSSPLICEYYDRMGKEQISFFIELLTDSVPLSKIANNAGEKNWRHNLSEKIVYHYKKFRDIKTGVKAVLNWSGSN